MDLHCTTLTRTTESHLLRKSDTYEKKELEVEVDTRMGGLVCCSHTESRPSEEVVQLQGHAISDTLMFSCLRLRCEVLHLKCVLIHVLQPGIASDGVQSASINVCEGYAGLYDAPA